MISKINALNRSPIRIPFSRLVVGAITAFFLANLSMRAASPSDGARSATEPSGRLG